MKRQVKFLVAVAAVALGGQPGFVQASPLDFCGDSENGNKGGVYIRGTLTDQAAMSGGGITAHKHC